MALIDITGLEEFEGEVRLIDRELKGKLIFFNSGVWVHGDLPEDKLTFESLGLSKKESPLSFQQGERYEEFRLRMPSNSTGGWHCHPGGERAEIISGKGYFDVNARLMPLINYGLGSNIRYGVWSTHRPTTGTEGTTLNYTSFNGTIFAEDNPEKLIKKMIEKEATIAAMTYAVMLMFQDTGREPEFLEMIKQNKQF